MQRFILASFFLVLPACGGAVAPSPSEVVTTDSGPTPEPKVEWSETASCDAVKASCGADPAVVVRGHAAGLAGLDGARVEFAVRYLNEEGMGLDVPHGVAIGRTHVSGGEFATCVCVPHGANMYPQIAAVVYRVGTTGLASRDVARATFSQRYATLGDEDVSYALNAVPDPLHSEAAVAAMVERTARTTFDVKLESVHIYAGLIADERPLAAQVTGGALEAGKAQLTWTMPGRAWSTERVAFFADRNANGKCDVDGTDTGAIAPFASSIGAPAKWLTGSELAVVCDALRVGASRE
jgi:hypothetical protein